MRRGEKQSEVEAQDWVAPTPDQSAFLDHGFSSFAFLSFPFLPCPALPCPVLLVLRSRQDGVQVARPLARQPDGWLASSAWCSAAQRGIAWCMFRGACMWVRLMRSAATPSTAQPSTAQHNTAQRSHTRAYALRCPAICPSNGVGMA